jgi:hypothetical protein
MATQTRRTTRRSARFFWATVKAYMVMACCGLVLMSAVAAHAALNWNGMPMQGLMLNGMPFNGLYINGMLHDATPPPGELPPAGQRDSLPFHGLSKRALGAAAVLSGSDDHRPLPIELPDIR